MSMLTAWDVETDPANPQPNIWPECPTCSVAWVWRYTITLDNAQWMWTRDCKHKTQPVLWTADGPYEPEAATS